jgi:mannose-6-phosphate isomerase-like protein (cupin superfamily)
MKSRRDRVTPYITRDGSEIRELMHPDKQQNANQSLAEATVPPGVSTYLHMHRESEEIYYVTRGSGEMELGDERFGLEQGDSICIPPGTPHRLHNNTSVPLVILCCCAPAYRHEDTELL